MFIFNECYRTGRYESTIAIVGTMRSRDNVSGVHKRAATKVRAHSLQ